MPHLLLLPVQRFPGGLRTPANAAKVSKLWTVGFLARTHETTQSKVDAQWEENHNLAPFAADIWLFPLHSVSGLLVSMAEPKPTPHFPLLWCHCLSWQPASLIPMEIGLGEGFRVRIRTFYIVHTWGSSPFTGRKWDLVGVFSFSHLRVQLESTISDASLSPVSSRGRGSNDLVVNWIETLGISKAKSQHMRFHVANLSIAISNKCVHTAVLFCIKTLIIKEKECTIEITFL